MSRCVDADLRPAPEPVDPAAEATADAAPPGDATRAETAPPAPAATWDDVPLRRKLNLVLALIIAVAAAVPQLTHGLGLHAAWCLLPLAAVAVSGTLFTRRHLLRPIEELTLQLQRIVQAERPVSLNTLPRHRQDEVGQLARAIHRLGAGAIRDYHEARSLRRTLDDRIAKATRRATRQLSELASRDPLTDLGNRRFLDEHLEALVRSCRQADTDLICVLIDLDNFKQVNDTLGHAAGDALIQFVARLIQASVRDNDLSVRLGGDEFAVLMPGCELERAHRFAERTRAIFREHAHVSLPETVKPDLSIGIASLLRDAGGDGGQLLARADALLYAAKQRGKGCTVAR